MFFAADDGVHGLELWSSDGTAWGTRMVKDIWPGTGSGIEPTCIVPMKELAGRLYFNASDSIVHYAIWSTDGTPANTIETIHLAPGDSSFIYPYILEVVNGRLY